MPSLRLPLLARHAGALKEQAPLLIYALAAGLITTGVAVIFWPAALICAGVFLLALVVL